jgi:flagellar hook-associated protein 3 FlgL
MRVSSRGLYYNVNLQLGNIAEQLKQINEQIASQKRINKPSDDPIGITQALRLKKVLSQIGQYGKNIQHGQSRLSITDSALQTVNGLIVRGKEIANQMSTGTYNGDQRSNAAQEIKNIIAQLVQLGNTELIGRHIFSGYKEDTAPFTNDLYIHNAIANSGNDPDYTGSATSSGAYTGLYSKQYVVEITSLGSEPVGTATYAVSEDGGLTWGNDVLTSSDPAGSPVYNDINSTDQGARITFTNFGTLTAGDQFTIEVSRYNGDEHDMEIAIGSSAQMKINLTGTTVFGEAGDTENNIFDILVGLRDSLENNNVEGIQSRLDQLNNFQPRVVGNMADVGSRLNRIDMCKNILSDLDSNYTERLSDIEDLDLVKAINDLSMKQTAYKAVLYSVTQISSLSLVDFLR